MHRNIPIHTQIYTKNDTIYNVYFSYEGYVFKQAVAYYEQDETKTEPPRIKGGYANYSTGFYNHYNYENFVNLLKIAFLTIDY